MRLAVLVLGLALCFASVASGQPSAAEATRPTESSPISDASRLKLFHGQEFDIDLVGVDQGNDGGDVAVEWQFDLQRDADFFPDFGQTHASLHLEGNGFLVLTDGPNDKDQIKNQIKLDFLPLFAVRPPRDAKGIGFWAESSENQVCVADEAFAQLIATEPSLKAYAYPEGVVPNVEENPVIDSAQRPELTCILTTDVDLPETPQSVRDLLSALRGDDVKVETLLTRSIKRARDQGAALTSPLSIQAQLTGSWETTQDLDNHDLVAGAGIGLASSYLSALFDLPFSLLRTAPNNEPRMLDARFSYEFVGKIERGGSADFNGATKDVSRLSLDVEWETGVFKSDRVSFFYSLKHELNPSDATKARGRRTNHFFQAKLEHLLVQRPNAEVDLALIYTRGELAPVFETGHTIGGGLSVRF